MSEERVYTGCRSETREREEKARLMSEGRVYTGCRSGTREREEKARLMSEGRVYTGCRSETREREETCPTDVRRASLSWMSQPDSRM